MNTAVLAPEAPVAPVTAALGPATAAPAADLLPVGHDATVAFKIGRALVSPLLRALFRFKVEGLENLPRDGSNYVLIANHLNWIDSFAIQLAFPSEPRIHFVGDPAGLMGRRFQWWFIRKMGGYVSVDRSKRGDPCLFDHVQRCLERGGVLALYPEGCYGDEEGELRPFKKGFAHFALRAGVDVLPVALTGHKHLWFRKTLRMTIGRRIATSGMDVETLTARGETEMRALMPEYHEPRGLKLFRNRLTHLF